MSCEVKVIATGSKGNAVLLNGEILIDCGGPFRELEPYYKNLRLVLLTHIHGDHFNPETIKRLHFLRPGLRYCVPPWLEEPMARLGISAGVTDEALSRCSLMYSMPDAVCFVRYTAIPHDVPNCAWHIVNGDECIFYATDCASLSGVSAPSYDLYLVEANYGEEELQARMQRKLEAGAYAYESRVADSHLSREQAEEWIAENACPGISKVLYLHRHQE